MPYCFFFCFYVRNALQCRLFLFFNLIFQSTIISFCFVVWGKDILVVAVAQVINQLSQNLSKYNPDIFPTDMKSHQYLRMFLDFFFYVISVCLYISCISMLIRTAMHFFTIFRCLPSYHLKKYSLPDEL